MHSQNPIKFFFFQFISQVLTLENMMRKYVVYQGNFLILDIISKLPIEVILGFSQ